MHLTLSEDLVESLPNSSGSSVSAGSSTSPILPWMLVITGMEHCSSIALLQCYSCNALQKRGLGGTALVTKLNFPRRGDTLRPERVAD